MKKGISFFMAVLFFLATTTITLAATNNDAEKKQKKNAGIVNLIASGDDYLVGEGVPFEYGSNDQDSTGTGDINVEWASGGVNHTHQYLTSRALTILRNDKGDKTANLLSRYATTLLANSDWPDTNENDWGFYLGHFYDPVSGKTILGFNSPTAMSRFLVHAQNAKKYYAKNKTASMQELGRALHYLSDINVPHHAALLTALNSNHTTFENWVDANRANYVVNNTNFYSGLTSADAKTNFTGYCKEIINLSAYHALDHVSEATSDSLDNKEIAAKATMDYSQEIMAAFLYNFLRSVGSVK